MFKLIIVQLHLLPFSIKLSIDALLPEAEYSFSNITRSLFYVQIGLPIDKK